MRSAEEIRKILKENNISGYKLEKDLKVTQVGADKFLNGETKKPYKKTLLMYDEYINNGFKTNNSYVNETEEDYNSNEICEIDGVKIKLKSLVSYIATNEEKFMNEKIFSNIIEIRVSRKLAEITASKENLYKYLKI
ncbi:hypothetical protein T190115A13A_270031 [Tenacibaculum sp. 190524A02b]|uniref:Transcriptional regulator n=1 Tax=Tenacibaculum vairaonense TaxID=3137860 RepID=A0ABP1FDU5_9FLAO